MKKATKTKTVPASDAVLKQLGLSTAKMKPVFTALEKILCDYHVFYQNVRGFHWNVQGGDFFDLHEKFEELYTSLYKKIDILAERMITLGHVPCHVYSDYLKSSEHKEIKNVFEGEKCVLHVVKGLSQLIIAQREAAGKADDADDIVTADMLTGFNADLEKRIWMFRTFLND